MPKVHCDVRNCVFWAEGDECTADEIEIMPNGPTGETKANTETYCRTFELKDSVRDYHRLVAAPKVEGVNRDVETGRWVDPDDGETASTMPNNDNINDNVNIKINNNVNSNVNYSEKRGKE